MVRKSRKGINKMQARNKQLMEMCKKSQERLDELETEKSRLQARWSWASDELIKRGYVLSKSGDWLYAPKHAILSEAVVNPSDEEFARHLLIWKTLFLRSKASTHKNKGKASFPSVNSHAMATKPLNL